MNQQKMVAFSVVFILVGMFFILLVDAIACDSAVFGNELYQDTPEKALVERADDPLYREILTPKIMLDTIYLKDEATMFFVAENDSLVIVGFKKNKKGLYMADGWKEEWCLESPVHFLLNGNPEQFVFESADQYILIPYHQSIDTVYGWCYSGLSFTVNGIVPSKKSYTFDCQGKTWSIDFWWADGVPPDAPSVDIVYSN